MNSEQSPGGYDASDLETFQAVMQSTLEELYKRLPEKAGTLAREVMDFRTSIIKESDRGAALMAAAFLDDKLRQLLEMRLVLDRRITKKAFDFNGPLGTFSSRIDFCYLLGILPKNAANDLHTIRAVRNKFAHHASPLTFDIVEVKAICNRLAFHGCSEEIDPGQKFRRSVMGILMCITRAITIAEHIEPQPEFIVPSRDFAKNFVKDVFTKLTGKAYPLQDGPET